MTGRPGSLFAAEFMRAARTHPFRGVGVAYEWPGIDGIRADIARAERVSIAAWALYARQLRRAKRRAGVS